MTPTERDDEHAMTPAERDEERDAYLSEALRHAPDAALGPPPALSDAILREATRSASAPSPPPPSRVTAPASWAGAVWDWLARPAVAAGFASLVAATLVGMMWWDRPLDETLPRPQAEDRAPPSRSEPSTQALRRAAPNAEEGERRSAPEAPKAFPTAPAQTAPAARPTPPTAAAPPATVAAPAAAAPFADAPRDAKTTADGRLGDTRERSLSKRAQEDALANQERRQAKGRHDASGSTAAAAQGAARATGLADVRRDIADAPGPWSWQRDGGPARPAGAGLQNWLGEVEAAMARSPIAAAAGSGNAAVAGGAAGLEVRLLRSGRTQVTLRLGANSVSVERADEPGADRLAVPGPDEVAALKARLAELER